MASIFPLSKAFDLSLEVLKFDIEEVINEVGKKISSKLNEKKFRKYLFLIGPGNNGCDGLATIKFLKTKEKIDVYLYDKGKNFKSLNKKFLKELSKKIEIVDFDEVKKKDYECIVEAFFGTGFKGDLNSEAKKVISICNRKNAFKISIDVPVKAFKADLTYSMNEKKAKNAEVIKLSAYEKIENEFISFMDLLKIKTFEKERKGLNGKLLILAGSAKYLGSLYFASYCASQFCDLVYYHCPEQKENMANEIPEAIPINDLEEIKQKIKENYFDSILIGPGITIEKKNNLEEVIDICLEKKCKLVLDAFGIDMIKEKFLNENVLLTPHKGEFKRVFEKEANLKRLKEISTKKNCNILLKGKTDYLCTYDGKIYKNVLGNNGLTKGGTGDTLAGLISSIATQNDLIISAKASILLLTYTADELEKTYGKNYSVRILIENIPKVYYSIIQKINS